jgi:hypothetical protein
MLNVPFQGYEASWADITTFILGRPVVGILRVMYRANQNKVNIYGAGNEPIARGKGNKEYEGEIQLLQSEVEALRSLLLPGQTHLDLGMFSITVTYNNGGVVITDRLENCEFTSIEKGMNQGDTNMTVTLPIILSAVRLGV